MKKSFMVAAILVVVVSMFIGCALPIEIPGVTGGSGETAGHTSGSSTGDISQDIRRMLVVPEDAKKVVDAAMALFVGENQWVDVFNLYLWDEKERLWVIHFYIDTSKEPADKQFHKMAEILKGFGYPQEDIHLNLSEQRKELELQLSSESTGSVEHVYVDYISESLEINIMVLFDPSGSKLGLDVDKGNKYDWSCTKDVASMLGVNIKNILENLSYTASYEEEGYNDIGMSITNFKDQEAPELKLFAEGYLGQSGIENVVEKIEMVRDTYGGSYLMDDGGAEGIGVTLEDARCNNSPFNVYFSTLASPDDVKGAMLDIEIAVK
ncbi:MAG TPA: hypothetical protein EYP16_02780 [Candidatus Atribacteria bacterium]|nr:hypothetical protein [Candidatus Atribacteria bacterium]